MSRALFTGLLALALSGCSVPFGTEDIVANRCTSNEECGAGSACVPAGDTMGNVCGATHAELGKVILEVRSTTLQGGTTSFVFADQLVLSGDFGDGVVPDLLLGVPPNAAFTGRTFADAGTPAECAAADGSVPAAVELRYASALAFSTQLSGQTTAEPGDPVPASHRFTVDAAPGIYDVYIAPQPSKESCSAPPPRLFRHVEIPSDVATVDFTAPDDPPFRLGGTLKVPADVSLEGWVLEIVDPTYGKVISDSAPLPALTTGDTLPILGADGSAEGLRYYFTEQALLRLRDAKGSLSVHWALGAVDFDGDGVVVLDLRDLIATPMPLAATIIDADGKIVPSAHVTIRSQTLTGDANNNAVYRTTADSDADGTIQVRLVPGTYAVTIVPSTPGAAAFYGAWEVTQTGGNGKGFQLEAQPELIGSVATPEGGSIGFTPVVASPSQQNDADYFSLALGAPSAASRQLSTTLDADGAFSLLVDPGSIDVSVQVSPDTAYPWVVVPRSLVLPAAQEPFHDFGVLELPKPVVVRGTVSSPMGPVPLAVVRAWLSADGSGDPSSPVVQIGEVVTDEAGRFFLPLPPSITAPEAP